MTTEDQARDVANGSSAGAAPATPVRRRSASPTGRSRRGRAALAAAALAGTALLGTPTAGAGLLDGLAPVVSTVTPVVEPVVAGLPGDPVVPDGGPGVTVGTIVNGVMPGTTPTPTSPVGPVPGHPVQEPVLAVCGFHFTWDQADCSSSIGPLVTYLRTQGLDARWVDTASSNDVTRNALVVRDTIAAVLAEPAYRNAGITRVSLVGHSMGGLVNRYVLRTVGTAHVHRYVSIGTGQYGSPHACAIGPLGQVVIDDQGMHQLCSLTGEYKTSSTVLRTLNGHRAGGPTGGGADDTPAGVMPWSSHPVCAAGGCRSDRAGAHVEYYAIWLQNADDGLASLDFPPPLPTSHQLDGGACEQPVPNTLLIDPLPKDTHGDEPSYPYIQQRVLQALRGVCEGTPVYRPW